MERRFSHQLRFALFLVLLLSAALSCRPVPNIPKIEFILENSGTEVHQVSTLQDRIERNLERNLHLRTLSQDQNAAWQVIHGAVAYGSDLLLDVNGKPTLALQYLFSGGELRGWELHTGETIPETGRLGIRTSVEAGSYTGQGHVDQFLGYISQVAIPLDTKIFVDGNELTLEDWARQSQRDIEKNPYQEYSWTLIALCNYFPEVTQWLGADGKILTLEPFVRHEAEQDLTTSACGGMHRLMGLAHSVKYRERLGGRLEGGWLKAKQVVETAIQKAKIFQNSDGSFSTRYTSRAGNSADMSTCIGATGHTLEFLAYALPESELQSEWMERAVERLCQMLEATENIDLECGAGYHALAGLRIYSHRRFKEQMSLGKN